MADYKDAVIPDWSLELHHIIIRSYFPVQRPINTHTHTQHRKVVIHSIDKLFGLVSHKTKWIVPTLLHLPVLLLQTKYKLFVSMPDVCCNFCFDYVEGDGLPCWFHIRYGKKTRKWSLKKILTLLCDKKNTELVQKYWCRR